MTMKSLSRRKYQKRYSPLNVPSGVPEISGEASPLLRRLAEGIGRKIRFSFTLLSCDAFRKAAGESFPDAGAPSHEAFLLHVAKEGVMLSAPSQAGLFYGFQAFLMEMEENGLHELVLYESPLLPERGLKLYLPSPTEEGIAEFKRIIDLAALCRLNFIMLELGGALEYRLHPEINEGWKEYVAVMNEYPGKTIAVQNAYSWRKNSIHSENGGGGVLSQEQFLELVQYCRERFLEVVPEMPSLSHSDYLLIRHRELAERSDDPFPDTCCPSYPEYYRLFFDLLDEVIALLNPQRINIGHDEYYSIGLCPLCRGKSAPELYAHDIHTISEHLRSKNVKTILWGEKLLDSHWRNGDPIGGAAVPAKENMEALPATFPAIDTLDGGIEIFHWYWGIDSRLEEDFAERGMDYCFANFNAAAFRDWHRRIASAHVKGVCISNWGQTSLRTLQRNGVLYDLFYSSFLLWNSDFGSEDYPELDRLTMRRLYRLGASRIPAGSRVLTVCHTVQTSLKFQYFFDGCMLDEARYYLGDHVFRAGDGRLFRFPVVFGSNISNTDTDPARRDDPFSIRSAYEFDSLYQEVAYETYPERDADGRMWYFCCYSLPEECREVTYLRFESAGALVPPVRVKSFYVQEGGSMPWEVTGW